MTPDDLTPEERDTVQMVLLRRYLQLTVKRQGRRRSDLKTAAWHGAAHAAQRDRIYKLRKQGYSLRMIADKVGCSEANVRYYLRTAQP